MSFCSFFGKEHYKDHFKSGMYVCSQCDHPLFNSRSKYAHSSPWPAFTETIREDSVTKHMESLTAFKVLCGKCVTRSSLSLKTRLTDSKARLIYCCCPHKSVEGMNAL
ncbi:hypothetical protein AALO_G00276130 [Alosa alosa]|uniref:MsrB domain-containing protein n=1 Tax=Alosa alosa TaxID=278164 RepID=A0AAV6FLK5_9TELE|nr:hypothetical protein AALO_G00276130 [Alosa alosa]